MKLWGDFRMRARVTAACACAVSVIALAPATAQGAIDLKDSVSDSRVEAPIGASTRVASLQEAGDFPAWGAEATGGAQASIIGGDPASIADFPSLAFIVAEEQASPAPGR